MDPMMKFTFALTDFGDFDVHVAGCRDIAKGIRSRRYQNQWTNEAESVDAAIQAEVDDFQACEQDYTAENFRVLPCCRRR